MYFSYSIFFYLSPLFSCEVLKRSIFLSFFQIYLLSFIFFFFLCCLFFPFLFSSFHTFFSCSILIYFFLLSPAFSRVLLMFVFFLSSFPIPLLSFSFPFPLPAIIFFAFLLPDILHLFPSIFSFLNLFVFLRFSLPSGYSPFIFLFNIFHALFRHSFLFIL